MLKGQVWTRSIQRPDLWRGLRIALPLAEAGGAASVFSSHMLGGELTTGVLASNTASNTWRGGKYGAELTGRNEWFLDQRAELWGANPVTLREYTLLWAGTFDAIPAGDAPLVLINAADSTANPAGAWANATIALIFDKAVFGTGVTDAIRFRSATTTEDVYIGSITPGPKVVVGRHSNTRAPDLFIDGSNAGSTVNNNASATISGGTNNTNLDWVVLHKDLTLSFSDGGTAVALLWDRWLDDGEVSALSDDPWLPFRAAPSRKYFVPATSGDTLTANDIASDSSVSAPSIGQAHALTGNSVASASSVSTPAVGQEHALTGDDVSSASSVSSPTLAENTGDNLLANDISAQPSVGTPSVGQVHALLAEDISAAPSVSNPALGDPSQAVVIIEGGDDVPKRRRQAEEALDAVLERAAAEALGEVAPEQEIAAVVEQVRQDAQENPLTREQAEEIGLPLDMAAELATLARIDAAIKDRNQQLSEEQDVIIALLLAA